MRKRTTSVLAELSEKYESLKKRSALDAKSPEIAGLVADLTSCSITFFPPSAFVFL
jgi:hypothetical protein